MGTGACRQFAPSVYQLDEEGYLDLSLLQVPPDLERAAAFGASACPSQAITVLYDELAFASTETDTNDAARADRALPRPGRGRQ